MDGVALMSILFVVLALALLGLFAVVWLKDRTRSREEAHDPARRDTDTSGTRRSPERRGNV